MTDINARIDKLYLVRYKKLKNGRKAIRSMKTCPVRIVLSESQTTTDFNIKYGSGKLAASINKDAGSINVEIKDFIPTGYAKGRGFSAAAYALSATNTTPLGRV